MESLGEAEDCARHILNRELDRHLTLTGSVFNLVSETLTSIPESRLIDVPAALKVTAALVHKVSNDLRTAALLAVNGYAIQAATVVVSLQESALTVAYIGDSDDRATAWIKHTDPTRSFRSVSAMVKDVYASVPLPDAELRRLVEYRTYRQLSMAKHTNPLFFMAHAYQEVEPHVVAARNGPDTSEPAVRAAWFALEQGARLTLVALASFIEHFVPADAQAPLMPRLGDLARVRHELHEQARARWGTEDPFPGKWKT